jgi:hypothetical protein
MLPIKDLVKHTSQEIQFKLRDSTHTIKVDANILKIPSVLVDQNLVPVAKVTYMQLPLPIRNLVIATSECEQAYTKLIETYWEDIIRRYVMSLEKIVQSISSSIQDFDTQIGLKHQEAKRQWQRDMEDYRTDILDLFLTAGFELLPDHDMYDQLIQLGPRLMILVHKKRIDLPPEESKNPDLASVMKRIEVSRNIRQHSAALTQGLHYQDIHALPKCEMPTPEIQEESPVTHIKIQSDTQCMKLLQEQRRLKGILHQLWLPHRKALMEEYQNVSSAFITMVTEVCREFENTVWPMTPNVEKINETRELLKQEYSIVVQTFPCDPSALKTCTKVAIDGINVAHCRKLQELKLEMSRALNMYLGQINTFLLRYHENCKPVAFL